MDKHTVSVSKKINGAGGFYTFNSQGAGPRYGLIIGYMMWFSYFMVITNAILFTSGVFIPGTISYFLGISIGNYTWIPIMTAFLIIITIIAYLGIKPSLAYSFTASAIEIILLIITSIVIIVALGPKIRMFHSQQDLLMDLQVLVLAWFLPYSQCQVHLPWSHLVRRQNSQGKI